MRKKDKDFPPWHFPPLLHHPCFSPGECGRTVEVVEQGGFTHVGGPLTHLHTGLAQGTQVESQCALRRPNRGRFTAKILRRSGRKKLHAVLSAQEKRDSAKVSRDEQCPAYGYLVSDIGMNSLQHSPTCKLPRRERLDLQEAPQERGTSKKKLEHEGATACEQHRCVHHLCAQDGSHGLAHLRLVGRVHRPHVGLADERFGVRVLGGNLRVRHVRTET